MERWKISTYPNLYPNHYKISDSGKFINIKTNHILKPYVHKITGYEVIKLKYVNPITSNVSYRNFFVHKLVGWEYCEHHPGCTVCNHLDGNKRHNTYTNLEWCTSGENTRHALKTGLNKLYGPDNYANIYSEDLVRKICSLIEKNISAIDIVRIITGDENARSRKYSKLYALVTHLRYKDRFTYICNEYSYEALSKINDEDPIVKLLRSGYENIDIMKLYGYNHISENTSLYTKILNTRKILTQVQRSGKA